MVIARPPPRDDNPVGSGTLPGRLTTLSLLHGIPPGTQVYYMLSSQTAACFRGTRREEQAHLFVGGKEAELPTSEQHEVRSRWSKPQKPYGCLYFLPQMLRKAQKSNCMAPGVSWGAGLSHLLFLLRTAGALPTPAPQPACSLPTLCLPPYRSLSGRPLHSSEAQMSQHFL